VVELRQRASAGEKKARLAREFGISRETLYQYLREFRLLSGWSGFCGVRGLARGKRIGCRARANCLRQQGI